MSASVEPGLRSQSSQNLRSLGGSTTTTTATTTTANPNGEVVPITSVPGASSSLEPPSTTLTAASRRASNPVFLSSSSASSFPLGHPSATRLSSSTSNSAVNVPPRAVSPVPSGMLAAAVPPAGRNSVSPPLSARMPTKSIPFSRVMTSIDYKSMRFVVFDCPTDATVPMYLDELKLRNVTDVVRVCEPTYDRSVFEQSGIRVHDMPFSDGTIPPLNVIQGFLHLCDERFAGGISGVHSAPDAGEGAPAIGIHCVAGLGRAPVLVAMSLIEAGMVPLDAVEFVRKRRRGAFNSVQLTHLVDSYKRVWKKPSGNKFGGLLSSSSSAAASGTSAATGAAANGNRPVSPMGKKATNGAGDEQGGTHTPPMLRTKNSILKMFGGFGKKAT